MQFYDSDLMSVRQQLVHSDIMKQTLPEGMLTLIALVAPVSIVSFPIFRNDEIHTLEKSVCFHIEANKIPQNIRCSCLDGGRFCLLAEH